MIRLHPVRGRHYLVIPTPPTQTRLLGGHDNPLDLNTPARCKKLMGCCTVAGYKEVQTHRADFPNAGREILSAATTAGCVRLCSSQERLIAETDQIRLDSREQQTDEDARQDWTPRSGQQAAASR